MRIGRTTSGGYSITRVGGFSGAVAVSVDKLTPFDATLSLSATSLSGATTSTTLKVSTSRSTAAGTYSLRLRFTSGSLVKDQLVSVIVSKH
ncbi:MAG TPA: hypothetical protein VNM92_13660 [Thermoanaerobaculia bacterium]|nr:hypothetical protein [Thermoanaerobaculia bacterium]